MATKDDEAQARAAIKAVADAEEANVPLPCALEFVWVLQRVYRLSRHEVAQALGTLLRMPNLKTDVAAVTTGLQVHLAGGDFADGVIAAAGASMGSEKFVSLDRRAVTRLREIGIAAELLK